MIMIIGKIQSRTTKSGEVVLEGNVSTLLHTFRFRLVPNPNKRSLNAPAYIIVSWNTDGVEISIGAAWPKQMKRGGREGEEFLSLAFDDPSFPKPLHVAAFKNPDTGDWDVTYRRRQEQAA